MKGPSVHLCKPSARWEPKLQPPEEQIPCPASSQFFTRRPSASWPGCETHQDEPSGAALWITLQAKGVGHIMECRGKVFLGLPKIYYGMFRGGIKGWQRKDFSDMGRNRCEKVHLFMSGPATGMGLHPQGLISPGPSNWGDWEPGASYWAD